MTLVLGIDEAGKGPVIGSLFIAGALIEEGKIDRLKEIGAKDSKLLTHKKRVELAKKIKKIAKNFIVIEATPAEIDEAVDGNNSLNLNWFEAHHIADIINKFNPDKAIIDCPSPNIEKFKGFVKKLLKNKDVESYFTMLRQPELWKKGSYEPYPEQFDTRAAAPSAGEIGRAHV